MEINCDKIDDFTLALLYLVTSESRYGARAWKSFDWDTMDRLHQKGYISDPKGKAKSVMISEEGLSRAKELFEHFFAT
jgi:DNA-binding PadR family transcriptional regulator